MDGPPSIADYSKSSKSTVGDEGRLLEIVEIHRVERMGDLFAMVDAKLPEPFNTTDLANVMRSSRRVGQQAAFCFREAGVSEICGKDGNALIYRRLVGRSAC